MQDPAFSPAQLLACMLGGRVGQGARLVLAWCSPAPVLIYGMSLGSGSRMGRPPYPARSLARVASWSGGVRVRVQLRCLGISVLGRGLAWHAGLSGTLGPCFLLELLLLPRILPLCIFSNFPPRGFQSNFSICGSGSCCARFQLAARAAARGAGRRRCSATGTRCAPGMQESLLAGPVWGDGTQ